MHLFPRLDCPLLCTFFPDLIAVLTAMLYATHTATPISANRFTTSLHGIIYDPLALSLPCFGSSSYTHFHGHPVCTFYTSHYRGPTLCLFRCTCLHMQGGLARPPLLHQSGASVGGRVLSPMLRLARCVQGGMHALTLRRPPCPARPAAFLLAAVRRVSPAHQGVPVPAQQWLFPLHVHPDHIRRGARTCARSVQRGRSVPIRGRTCPSPARRVSTRQPGQVRR